MAGDWMKVEHDLPDKPEVAAMSATLGLDVDAVVGKLFKVWRWFDRQTVDGCAPGVTPAYLDSLVALEGFASALQKAGWLLVRSNEICIPKFDRHNSKSAKQRALAHERVKRSRNASRVTKTQLREEKRRVNTPIPPFPSILDVPEFHAALAEWLEYKPKPYKPAGLKALISRAANLAQQHGVAAVITAMERARANGWQGWDHDASFPKPSNGQPKSPRLPTPEEDAAWTPV